MRPRFADIDWPRTIQANLRHYQAEHRTIVPEKLIGFMRQQRRIVDLDEVVLCVSAWCRRTASSERTSSSPQTATKQRGRAQSEPRGDAPLHGAVSVSVDIEDDAKAAKVREAFAEFHADDVSEA